MRDFLRVLLMNVADLLDEQLSDDRLKGLLAFDATLGCHLGPRSPTSLLGLYYRLAGEIRRRCRRADPAERRHGRGHFSHLRGSGKGRRDQPHQYTGRRGSSLRKAEPSASHWPAARKSGRGRSFPPSIRQPLFLDLVGPREFDTGFIRKVKNIRMNGDAAKLNLALDRPPQFAGVDAAGHKGRLVIAPSPDHVERAFNPSKYGEFSPSLSWRSRCPALPIRRWRPTAPACCQPWCNMPPMR